MYIPSLLQVNLHREKVTWPGAIVQKAGEGMPNYEDNTRRGNLYITIDVDFPRGTFSDEDQEGLQMSTFAVVMGRGITCCHMVNAVVSRLSLGLTYLEES